MLFTERSLWTMLHGIGLGGGALLALTAALFGVYLLRHRLESDPQAQFGATTIARVTGISAALLWATTLVGTYLVFPPYRAAPPEGVTALEGYPRSYLLADPGTTWLHAFGMETKEHLPWIAAMLATAVAYVAWRYGADFLRDRGLRRIGTGLLAICFGIVAYVSILGVFVNKVAPLQ